MTTLQVICCPPDLADAVIEKCEATVLRGLAVCPDLDRAELMQRLSDKTALLWMVLNGQDCLAVGFTELVDDDAVAVFGLAGRNMWQWAKLFADRITAYAREEGRERVLFAGPKAYARIIPHAVAVGSKNGATIYERRMIQ